MSLLHKFAALGGNPATTYADDVFSAYTYTGNSSTQTITNGIDLSGKGGLVWTKDRDSANSHYLIDTARTNDKGLSTNSTGGNTNGFSTVFNFLSSGFSLGNATAINNATVRYASWTFRKAAKFFDVVTYTGNGTTQNISHSLGQTPGMIVVKRTDGVADWQVWHRGLSAGYSIQLNTTNAASNTFAANIFGNNTTYVDPTSSQFTVGSGGCNVNTGTYVAYLFAHDTATDGLIQCGSFTTDGGGLASVNLGWEPQYLMVKVTTAVNDWIVFDAARGFTVAGVTDVDLRPNTSGAEISGSKVYPTATGFGVDGLSASVTYIYMAIRRPNKPPTTGTQVYNAIARTGTGAAATVTGVGFAPDLVISAARPAGYNRGAFDRLRGTAAYLGPNITSAEAAPTDAVTAFGMDGISVGVDAAQASINGVVQTYINWFFKRAPGVFDEVCYTGTGANRTVAHNLGVAPELMVVKNRGAVAHWPVYSGVATDFMILSGTNATSANNTQWNDTVPTASVFSVGTSTNVNATSNTYVAYLFATKAGISKVFSYTGNGSSQTINCGFTTGARWVMIKRTDSTGDWFVWDSTRGIVAGNDPHLSLNTTAAEVTTDDSVDTDTTGFIVNQLAATNVNVTSATYIGLAFA